MEYGKSTHDNEKTPTIMKKTPTIMKKYIHDKNSHDIFFFFCTAFGKNYRYLTYTIIQNYRQSSFIFAWPCQFSRRIVSSVVEHLSGGD